MSTGAFLARRYPVCGPFYDMPGVLDGLDSAVGLGQVNGILVPFLFQDVDSLGYLADEVVITGSGWSSSFCSKRQRGMSMTEFPSISMRTARPEWTWLITR